MLLEKSTFVVTGASGGLGRHITRHFLKEGAHVVAVARDEDKLLHSLSDIESEQNERLLPIAADLTHWQDILRMKDTAVERFGGVDGLVHSMGGFTAGKTLAETEADEWDFMMNLNLKSAFLCSKALWPVLLKQGGGKIITLSALAALNPKTKRGSYQVSKAGLIALTKSLAQEGKEKNIQVNSIAPSMIETEANKKAMPDADSSKWVAPLEIAKLAAFLCSDRADDITGSIVEMPGKL
ncbi:MAG: SDR family oxidoreductase [candidate division KSB1 bacterium]|nr:SDR family oxidoreductase [candidate division KSB1 bacterium]